MKRIRRVALLLLLASTAVAAAPPRHGDDLRWFSDRSPDRTRHAGGMRMGMGREQDDNHYQRLWLVGGTRLKRPACIDKAAGAFFVLEPDDTIDRLPTWDKSKCVAIKFPRREQGYYNAYYLENRIEDGELRSLVAKAEVRRFEHDASREFTPIELGPKAAPGVPFDVLRLRQPDERTFSRPRSGDTLRFQFLLRNQPVAGVRVTLITQNGWRKHVVTDDLGIASIQLVRDYFPDWNDFNRRYRERFLVVARYREKRPGSLGGHDYQRASYTLTFPGRFSPNPEDYRSYAFGLTLGVIGFLVAGFAVYLYRRRRVRPFKETQFDED